MLACGELAPCHVANSWFWFISTREVRGVEERGEERGAGTGKQATERLQQERKERERERVELWLWVVSCLTTVREDSI